MLRDCALTVSGLGLCNPAPACFEMTPSLFLSNFLKISMILINLTICKLTPYAGIDGKGWVEAGQKK